MNCSQFAIGILKIPTSVIYRRIFTGGYLQLFITREEITRRQTGSGAADTKSATPPAMNVHNRFSRLFLIYFTRYFSILSQSSSMPSPGASGT